MMIEVLILLQDAVRQEKQSKERLSREKDVLIAEKFNLEQQLAVTFNIFQTNYKTFIQL